MTKSLLQHAAIANIADSKTFN